MENVRPLPFLPEWVQGVTNIRGEIVSVTDIAIFFDVDESTHRKKKRAFIVIHNGEVKTAVVVDQITATRMLYNKRERGNDSGNAEQSVLTRFLSASAVYHTGEGEEEVQLFDGEKFLSAIRI
ncbi:MAG: hypothetical protein D3910_19185 [Candidatus Electrothrix sp. ATG2]|nr:hypothetical protein [Candidatus Electrothrix sp. ATG2]